MEEWLLMQTFYHGLIQKSREQLDATAEGSFMSLTPGKAEVFIEKITANQSWTLCNTQSYHKTKEVLEEVCVLSTKMDVLLNWLEQRDNYKRDCQANQDAFNAQNKYREYLGVEFAEYQKISIPSSTTPLYNNRSKDEVNLGPPTKVSTKVIIIIIFSILNNITKRLVCNDKILESISAKMNSFSSAVKE
jgi:hypothetical protein